MKQSIDVSGFPPKVELQVIFIQEGKYIVAHAPALDLCAYGENLQEAREEFEQVLEIFMEDIVQNDTIDELLSSSGWEKHDDDWMPPKIIGQLFQEMSILMAH